MYIRKKSFVSLNVKENKEYSKGSQSWRKTSRKEDHMGQVLKDEKKIFQVDLGWEGQFHHGNGMKPKEWRRSRVLDWHLAGLCSMQIQAGRSLREGRENCKWQFGPDLVNTEEGGFEQF